MAEILVCAGDRPELGDKTVWKDGQVVAVQPDDWQWGRKERDQSVFTVVKSLGTSVERLAFLLQAPDRSEKKKRHWRWDAAAEEFHNDKTGQRIPLRRMQAWR